MRCTLQYAKKLLVLPTGPAAVSSMSPVVVITRGWEGWVRYNEPLWKKLRTRIYVVVRALLSG